jgi:hypothetical protein
MDSFIGAAEQLSGRHPSEPAFAGEVVDRDRSRTKRKLRLWCEDNCVELGDRGSCGSQ